ncbi:MAG: bifunctional lysylphosphatidylglycerol flippase/synthetase MprF [Nitrospirae bacterium]|nr:bifunctional lysylphosphatidylglycerol flippase/synthetase MprF [Candidatus Manganitrophaceae bacterium]
MKKSFLQRFGPLLGLILFATALWAIHQALAGYRYEDIAAQLKAIPTSHLLLSIFGTVLSYLVLTGYDAFAFRYIQQPLGYWKIARASFIGYTFSNNIGFSMIAGSTIRYRLYSAWGLSAVDVAKVIAFCTVTFWLGLFTMGGLVFILEPMALPDLLHLPFASTRPLGWILLTFVSGYLVMSIRFHKRVKIGGWEFSLPPPALSISQIAVACADWVVAGAVLYVLLPSTPGLTYFSFLGIFLLAQMAGLISQVPGGLGIVETVILLLLSPKVPAASIIGALLLYRGIYYLLPLGLAAILLGVHEITQRKEDVVRLSRAFGEWIPGMVPQVFAFTVFVAGTLLLFSGATPPVDGRIAFLRQTLPPPLLELSHFIGSLVGVGLLLVARGLQRRLDAAYLATAALLVNGIVFSLLKGLDYEEAVILAILLGAILPCRAYFYRKSALISERFSPRWISAITLILLGSVWLAFFSHKHLEFSGEPWWQLLLSGEASRALRATVGAIAAGVLFAVLRLFRPAPPEPTLPSPAELEKAGAIITGSPRTASYLALTGDKELLFNDTETAFLMYGVRGRSWVALGDPVGPQKEGVEIAWRFRELSDLHGGWTIFYQVGQEYLPLYLDLGLTLLKLGEEARVPLGAFSLEGGSRRGFRHTLHHLEKEGCTFEIIPQENLSPFLPEMKRLSDAWLAGKETREKRFSLGFFNERYLKRFPTAMVRQKGELIAFANLLLGAGKEELSVDLMRYPPGAPAGVMDFLLVQTMLWGKEQRYRWFNLGMAPLSGLQDRALAPMWERIGILISRHGEHFYHFQGLREYKEKFDPEWQPKYLASPGGLSLPHILTDIATLIAGGWKGVVSK